MTTAAAKCAAACKAYTAALTAEFKAIEAAAAIIDTAARKHDQAHRFALAA